MRTEIDRLLATELGRLGGPGARLVARWLPNNVGEHTIALQSPSESVWPRIRELLTALGEPVQLSEGEEAAGLSVISGSGHLRLNPTVVTVWLTPLSADETQVRIRAVSKEGLVKQRGGEQLAREVVTALQQQGESIA